MRQRHDETDFAAELSWLERRTGDVLALLDDRHAAAWSPDPARRAAFGSVVAQAASVQPDTQVLTLHGRGIFDLDSFCAQLEVLLPGPRLLRRLDGPGGVRSLLRRVAEGGDTRAPRFRYFLWHDADELIRRDAGLFGEIVDSVLGIATESEFMPDAPLIVQRWAFLGGPTLDVYAEDPNGQFHRWRRDASRTEDTPDWRERTGCAQPPVRRIHLEELVAQNSPSIAMSSFLAQAMRRTGVSA